ncbi:arabinan endo-1,5-alpha-L-arabinosidase [Phocaeicola salanitronis]|uniref:arabinan endo-1,5-alpha-L-arabinosidase n=1 Tax=Phocaeicola salanitronis TaxID=376805 RepID=UPI0025A3A50A|nr:arabinan endo-1,5-alpha-L-arabinosidase [Phocaeicola salanitronis]MDM8305134.1 arabinan endo-1,5-alpha-L-arabinosidase [Phocaeicola salanitronis]
MKRFYWINLLLACVFMLVACDDDENTGFGPEGVRIETPQIVEMTDAGATISAAFSIQEGVRYTGIGFCYSTDNEPTIYDSAVKGTVSNGTVTAILNTSELPAICYVRAFICIYNGATVYSEATLVGGDEQLLNYQAPTYPDDYTSIAGWESRDQWNLANVHDPSVMKADDGYYYMYQTDASYGNAHEAGGHFHCRRSQNLVDWEYLGGTMQEAPAWVKEKLNTLRAEEGLAPIENPNYGYWAPVVRKIRNGLYRMYYCIVVNDNIDGENSWGERAFIGLMETADPASNQWEDKGYVICSSSDKGMNDYGRPSASDWNAYFKYNAIDPTLVITSDNRHWLTYGSWHSGFATIELNPETGKTMNELPSPWAIQDNSYGALVATRGDRNNRWQASEGPDVVYRDGYYYMFIAYGQLEVAYNTRVVRSVNPEGPYVDMLGNSATSGQDMYPEVTAPYKFAGSEGWVGISHCGIFDDGNGNWFYASQGRFPVNVGGNQYSNAIMMGHIRSIRWTEDGWPVVMPERYGAVPKVAITQSELVGEWELIQFKPTPENSTLNDNAEQYGSVVITLQEEGTVVSNAWGEGTTWSFDADNNVLSIGDNKIYIQREVDWEKSPRGLTIVGGGYENGGRITNWMKKI